MEREAKIGLFVNSTAAQLADTLPDMFTFGKVQRSALE